MFKIFNVLITVLKYKKIVIYLHADGQKESDRLLKYLNKGNTLERNN